MCFGKKEKPQMRASPQEKSGPGEPGPRRAGNPPQVSQSRAPDQQRASRRLSGLDHRTTQGQNHIDIESLPPQGRRPRRARSLDGIERPRTPDQRRTDKRRSRLDHTPGLDGGIIIAVMGVTGAGKSYFIREVTGNQEVKVSGGLYSSTSKVQPYSFEYAGARITLVDTPGFNDTNRSDTEVLKEIADWTSRTYKKNKLLSGIIYLHPITHTRMEGSAMRNLRMFQNLCGQEVLENVLLTTTQWSNVNPAEGQAREDNLRDEGLWGGLIGKGATLQRFNGTRESGLELIDKLVSKTRKPLHIQDEIVIQHMTLPETDAGKFLNEGLAVQEKKFRRELESLEKQLQEAIKAKDGEMNRVLAAEQAKAQEKLSKAAAEQKLLERLRVAEVDRHKSKGRGERDRAVAGPSGQTKRPRPKSMFVQGSSMG